MVSPTWADLGRSIDPTKDLCLDLSREDCSYETSCIVIPRARLSDLGAIYHCQLGLTLDGKRIDLTQHSTDFQVFGNAPAVSAALSPATEGHASRAVWSGPGTYRMQVASADWGRCAWRLLTSLRQFAGK